MKLKILIAAGMMERKLISKIEPIIKSELTGTVFLVRKDKIDNLPKTVCYSQNSKVLRLKVINEIVRIFTILGIIIRKKPDLIIGIGMVPHGIITGICGKLTRTTTISQLMGKNDLHLTYPGHKLRQRILTRITGWADMIGTRGTVSREWLISQGIPGQKIFIPHNVFDFDSFLPGQEDKLYDLIYIGHIRYYKRVDLLVDVVDKLVNAYNMPEVSLAVIGNGKLKKKIMEYAALRGVSRNIHFPDTGDAEYLNHKLNQSRIFIMTSQGEGLPMAAVEALSCGIPVAIFQDSDIPDICVHEYNSMLSPLYDTDSMAWNVNRMLTDNHLYNTLSEGASRFREEKEKEYSPENLEKIWEDVLINLFPVKNSSRE
jgi:glycosyltransferase involved in cell wall biosynthesis